MKILSLKTIRGPNVYHQMPVVVMRLELLEWTHVASNEIPGFNDRLIKLLPGISFHSCSPGRSGGFYERLLKGTYTAHIIEHIALELSQLCNIEVTYGKSRYAGTEGVYDIVTRFTSEEGMKECLRTAVDIMRSLLYHTELDLEKCLSNIKHITRLNQLGISTGAIIKAAEKRNIPTKRLGQDSFFLLGYGNKQRRIQASLTDKTSLIASDLVQDKALTKEILKEALIPVPRGITAIDEEQLKSIFEVCPGPFVLKPLDGHHGKGVSLNLKSLEDLKAAFAHAQKFSNRFIVEEMKTGNDYRILMVDGKLVAAAERRPPSIVGDGSSTIQEAIKKLNENPLRGEGHECFLTQVIVDDILTNHLKQQGLSLTSVPASGAVVQLRGNANLSSGGTASDVTELVHPEVRSLCERVARLVDLDICGIDIISEGIHQPIDKEKFSVIEVNAGPGLRMHLANNHTHENVADKIVKMLYPKDDFRIPIIGVTGTNGKTTVVRLISKIMSLHGKKHVGMTSTEGIWINNERIAKGDCSGPASADLILSDPLVDCAVLELARGGLLRGGVAYDWSDIGVITNIRADHIGQDGIEDVEDLIWIKSLVAERVKKNGVLVLNADDESTAQIMNSTRVKKIPRSIYLFSVHATNRLLMSHISQNGVGLWLEGGWIILAQNGVVKPLLPAADIPLTINGRAEFQISNVLAAIAASLGAGVALETICRALKDFKPGLANPGRMNIYNVGAGYAILDYGHNEDAIINIGQFLNTWGFGPKTLVLGLPGDRSTELISSVGRAIPRYFDKAILRDDKDLRGRQPQEVPHLLSAVFREEKFLHEIILRESEAVHAALKSLQNNEVVVILFEDLKEALSVLHHFDPISVEKMRPSPAYSPELR